MPVSYGKGDYGKATRLHAQLVRQRGMCQRCYSRTGLQCAHIISRRYSRTRTLLDNAWCLCIPCHRLVDTWVDEKLMLVRETIGLRKYQELKTLALSTEGQKVDWGVELDRLRAVERMAT